MKSLVIILLLTSSCTDGFFFNRPQDPAMLRMLDGMQQLATGGGEFDRDLYEKIRSCMSSFDPDTPKAQDAAWQGIIDFWDQDGAPDDAWGDTRSEFIECNVTESDVNGMEIYEPCSYISNVAYYHSLLELCRRRDLGDKFSLPDQYITELGKMLSGMAMASSFFHGSNTKLGLQQDLASISLISYLAHQASLSNIPYSSILHDLSSQPRKLSSLEMAEKHQEMYLNDASYNWFAKTEALGLPKYEIIWAGTFINVIVNNFDPNLSFHLSSALLDQLRLTDQEKTFLLKVYLPEMQRVTMTKFIMPSQREQFRKNSLGFVFKVSHSLIWNEFRIVSQELISIPLINTIGNLLLPGITTKANSLLSYQYFDEDFQMSRNLYPGEQWCNPLYPHTKWHVLSALTLVDLINYSNEVHQVLSVR